MRFTFDTGSIAVNIATRTALRAELDRRWAVGEGFALATVNLDHLVKLGRDPAFLTAYQAQDLVVADGWPIRRLAQLAGHRIALMPGSDLVRPLCDWAAQAGVRVALVGATRVALEDAARVLRAEQPELDLRLCRAPSAQFDPFGPEADAILRDLQAENIGLCFLALGAPKQELFSARGRRAAPGVGFAGVGAGLDFLGGHQARAPYWLRRLGLEWLWRALGSPLRLGPRYLRCLAILPGQVRAALAQRRSG